MISPSLPSHSTENQILAGLDKTDYQHFFSKLERVSLPIGELIYEAQSPINYVYFPETAVFSMLATMEDGRTIEVGPSVRKAWWDYVSLSVLKQRRIEWWCTSGVMPCD